MMVGQSISHYKLVSQLGEGGMGVVYKAEDTKLNRQVALKFLAQHLLDDEEAKERFLREAQAAAALHHPNICPVYEIDDVDGKTFISMAFLKGETLEDRIAKGPLSLKDALDIARQTADGLEAAHEAAIIHRDIKPANIMVDEKGRTTIMDFGLARLTEASRLTKFDTAMGTVAYMSPEQAQGMQVDSRSDLWSLGCVLYEMVSGQRPFQGQYDQALLYEICHEEPAALTGLRTGVPIELELLTGKCLAKDRDDRYQSAKEIAVDLRMLAEKLRSGRSTILRTGQMSGAVPATMTAAQTVNPAEALPADAVVMKRSSQRALQGLAALFALAFLSVTAIHFTESPPEAPETPLRRFSFVPPPGLTIDGISAGLAISPNGGHLAFTTVGTDGGLWVQDLDQNEPRYLAGTDGARLPFWSPDSEYIVFATDVELRQISVHGGASGLVCGLPGLFFQGTWSPDGESIVFASTGGSAPGSLFEVPSQGGTPEELVVPADVGETGGFATRPAFVSSGRDRILLFTVGAALASTMYAKNLDTGQTAALGRGDRPIYSAATGHLIYQSDRDVYDLWARPFSPETLEFTGPTFPLQQNARQPSLAHDGTLAFLDGSGSTGAVTLVWRDRAGTLLEVVGQPQPTMFHPALSPDGQRIAVTSLEMGDPDIWVHDLVRSTKTRLTFDPGSERTPTWSPSGEESAYWLQDTEGSNLKSTAADGTGEPTVLVESPNVLSNPSWSRDGRYLVYEEVNPETGPDIRYVQIETDGSASEPVTFLATSAGEYAPKLSPDGRFVAYVSVESGRDEIYVRLFPEGTGTRQVSVNGGVRPRWSSDGTELYYVQGSALMAVSVSTGQGVTLGRPQQLFESPELAIGASATSYDVSADGQRFIMVAPVEDDDEDAAPPKIRVVQNWYEEFRDREE